MPAAPAPVHALVQQILDELRGALRFRWIALIVAWCVAMVLWAGIFFIPNTYEAKARVFVNTRTTLTEATKGISLGSDIGSQIERVREAMTGIPELEKVAEETGMLVGALTPEAKQLVIGNLRKNIGIKGAFSYHNPSAAVFTITYKNHSRTKSLEVVNHLLNTFVEGSLGGNQQGSQQAQQFLQTQLADYGKRLNSAEQRLASFKRRNVGLMPKDQQDYFSRLQSETSGLNAAKEKLAVAVRKRKEIESELHSGQPFIAGTPSELSGPAGIVPSTTEQQIEQTQQQLDQLLLKYTDKYPAVIALRETLKELKARQRAEIAAARHGDQTAAAQVGLAANPVYQKLQEQYNEAKVNIASIEQDVADREQRIKALQGQVNAAPEVQAEFSQLMRNYDVTRSQYNALLQRLDRARLGQQAAATGTIKFQVIDPPTAQYKPVAPNRPLLIIAALIGALAVGIAAAYGLHLLRPVFVSTRQLGAVTGLQVLGAVSMAWYDRYRASRRRGSVAYVGWIVALFVLGVAILFMQQHIAHVVRELMT